MFSAQHRMKTQGSDQGSGHQCHVVRGPPPQAAAVGDPPRIHSLSSGACFTWIGSWEAASAELLPNVPFMAHPVLPCP